MKPVIGITPEAITLPSRRDGRGAFCGVSYSQAIEKAGGLPLILPLTDDPSVLDCFLEMCDGWLFGGGADVHGKFYRLRKADWGKVKGVDLVRDRMEIYLLKHLENGDRPVLGICRGIQAMNVAFGGTLLPDVPGHQHRKPEALAHAIEWTGDGFLKGVLRGVDRVNTSHHQALDRIAEGFVVTARATDGVVEVMEKPGARFFCAVQFHPERLIGVAPEFLRLFQELVSQALKTR